MEIKAGDVVQLKSGGPWMTVAAVRTVNKNMDTVSCDWFDDKNTRCCGAFAQAELEVRTDAKNLSRFARR